MRENVLRLLAALLIVVLSLGAPLPAQADCLECDSCTTEAPDAGCQPLGLACQLAQNCFGQMQNLAAPASAGPGDGSAGGMFAPAAANIVRSAFITPETAPPRL